ncbi:MAG: hypothetical protein Q4F72_11565, partial [Desulfovibrionaceae bacterium]|nr:hypothetical protein [Desulfovibrionaceae bacterium]
SVVLTSCPGCARALGQADVAAELDISVLLGLNEQAWSGLGRLKALVSCLGEISALPDPTDTAPSEPAPADLTLADMGPADMKQTGKTAAGTAQAAGTGAAGAPLAKAAPAAADGAAQDMTARDSAADSAGAGSMTGSAGAGTGADHTAPLTDSEAALAEKAQEAGMDAGSAFALGRALADEEAGAERRVQAGTSPARDAETAPAGLVLPAADRPAKTEKPSLFSRLLGRGKAAGTAQPMPELNFTEHNAAPASGAPAAPAASQASAASAAAGVAAGAAV